MSVLVTKLLVDLLAIVLLAATIFYCVKVNKRVRELQDEKGEFATLITRFDSTLQQAKSSIAELREMSQQVNSDLSERLDKANFLADDLAFMIEKGNKVATSINDSATKLGGDRDAPLMPPKRPQRGSSRDDTQSTAAANMGEAINRARGVNRTQSDEGGMSDKTARAGRLSARLRSRSERELASALKTGDKS